MQQHRLNPALDDSDDNGRLQSKRLGFPAEMVCQTVIPTVTSSIAISHVAFR